MKETSISYSRAFGAMLAFAATLTLPALAQPLSDSARGQIADILAQKSGFSDAQKKVDSSLVFAAKAARGELVGTSFEGTVPAGASSQSTAAIVEIKGTVSSSLLAQLSALGGQVLNQQPGLGALRVAMPLPMVDVLAANPDVQSISRQDQMFLNRMHPSLRLPSRYRQLLPKLPGFASGEHAPAMWFIPNGLSFFIGALTSQGYVTHRAKDVVAMSINGAGVKVGVLSDSASPARVAALIASGDLGPGTTVLPGLAGTGSDEGAAMMEIVQDMAPGAQLFFATANGGQPAMAANIGALAAAGCTIIVDDITYLAEAAFQDGTIAQAVNNFVAGGGLYFSSAGNSGNLTDATAGIWEGDFVNGGAVTSGPIFPIEGQGFFHSFGSANFDTLTAITNFISLKWSDPQGGSNNDYDLFITNSTGTTVKAFSAAAQTGTQNPFEAVQQGSGCGTPSASGYCPAAGDRIYIVLFSGAPRALRLDTNRGRMSIVTAGATFGHNAGPNTMSMAATAWNSARIGTKPFTGFANPVEFFSSDGPRKLFFNPNGTAITPGNLLFGTNGGTTFQKPDLTAADGVSAKTPGFNPFFGTSAAAPHGAGIAALVKAAKPTLTGAQIRQILINTSLDNMAVGPDRDGGYGIVMALPAVQAALAP